MKWKLVSFELLNGTIIPQTRGVLVSNVNTSRLALLRSLLIILRVELSSAHVTIVILN